MLSAVDFSLPVTFLFKLSFAKFTTFLRGMDFKNLCLSTAHSSWNLHRVHGQREGFQWDSRMFLCLALPVTIFWRHADVVAGEEKGSHDSSIALINAPLWLLSFTILLKGSCAAGFSFASNPTILHSSVTDIPRWLEVMHHLLMALCELWKPTMPLIGDAASLFIVCSKVKSIAALAKFLPVCLIEKAPDCRIIWGCGAANMGWSRKSTSQRA